MTARARVLRGRYVDSVILMRLASHLTALPGVDDAAAMMATAANKSVLAEGGFEADETASARPDDLLIVVKATDDESAEDALAQVERFLTAPPGADALETPVVRTLDDALAANPALNLAAISLPGEYAAAQARAALERDMHVFLFSSNVELEDEIALKQAATKRGLLCMGPDCGTAIISGKGLGFANAVQRGPVGIVAASGSGLQALTCLLDNAGVGISHAIGCGGRDLSDNVGALTTNAALDALLADDETHAIVILSKPQSPAVAAQLRARAEQAAKPVICCFLGDQTGLATLDDAARAAAEAVGVEVPPIGTPLTDAMVRDLRQHLATGQRFVRGLYAGGTLAYEAQVVLRQAGLDVASNAPLPDGRKLAWNENSEGHVVLDLGSEEFTRGRPHPMLDARARRARLRQEAEDPQVAVVLLDFVLGYGAAKDPAGDLASDIAAARAAAAQDGRELIVLVVVCGTERDPQTLSVQTQTLRSAGALVLPTNAAAARSAALVCGVGQRELVRERT